MPDEVLHKAKQKPEISQEEFKEMERLAHVHPQLSVNELKSWILTQYLLEELTTDQLERMEKCMESLLQGALTIAEFKELLERPYNKGGVGLYYVTAKRYSEKIEQVIQFVSSFKSTNFKTNHEKRREMVHLLRRFLLNDYASDLSYSQIVRLERAIVARLNQEVSPSEFVWLLEQPVMSGGVHLRSTSAIHLGEKLEIILSAMQQEYASS
jgi:hypothetical protein